MGTNFSDFQVFVHNIFQLYKKNVVGTILAIFTLLTKQFTKLEPVKLVALRYPVLRIIFQSVPRLFKLLTMKAACTQSKCHHYPRGAAYLHHAKRETQFH